MSNILNVRVRKLIKQDLFEYGKYILFFLGIGLAVPVILTLIFGRGESGSTSIFIGIGGINIYTDDFGVINVFNFFSFAFFTFFMFIGGIVAGAELPSHVRWGGSRKEYFVSTVISSVIVCLAFAPFLLLLNAIVNLFAPSGSAFYNLFYIGGGDIPILLKQFLSYVAIFLFGYCIPLFWQRFGWYIGVAVILAFIFLSGFLSFNFAVGFGIFDLVSEDYFYGIEWDFTSGFSVIFGIMLSLMIVVFGTVLYLLVKDMPVKVR